MRSDGVRRALDFARDHDDSLRNLTSQATALTRDFDKTAALVQKMAGSPAFDTTALTRDFDKAAALVQKMAESPAFDIGALGRMADDTAALIRKMTASSAFDIGALGRTADDTAALTQRMAESPAFDIGAVGRMADDTAALMQRMAESRAFDIGALRRISDDVAAMVQSPAFDAAALTRITDEGAAMAQRMAEFSAFDVTALSASIARAQQIATPDVLGRIARTVESMNASTPVFDPAMFAGTLSNDLVEAIARLRLRAEQLVSAPEPVVEDVTAFLDEVEQIAQQTRSPEARGYLQHLWLRAVVWLLKKLLDHVVIQYLVIPLFIALGSYATLALQSPSLPEAPPPPAAPVPSCLPPATLSDLTQGLPSIIRHAGPEAEFRTLEFLASIRNLNTRQAYAQALARFATWCEDRNLEIAEITTFTVTAYTEEMTRDYSVRTVSQHLAAIRLLFDHLVAGGVIALNPATNVAGTKRSSPKSKAAVLPAEDAAKLLDSIDVSDVAGLRDRALVATMLFGFARVSAVVAMDVNDYRRQGDGRWLHFRHTASTAHSLPAHPKVAEYVDAYLAAAGIGDDPNFPLWQSMTRRRTLTGRRMSRVDAFRVVKKRAHQAGLAAGVTCRMLRATALTVYLANGGTRAGAQMLAAYANARSMKRYEPDSEVKITAAEIARIRV
jgi:site-specific recombinase XerD